MKVLFVGYGNMGSALGEAWRREGLAREVLAVDPASAGRRGHFQSVEALLDSGTANDIDLVVLAVKPALARAALAALPASWGASAVLMSVAAGVTVKTLAGAAPAGMRIVRAMPNTPAFLGVGCTGVYAGANVDEELRARLGILLQQVGSVYWLDHEDQLNAVTAISGSGPAYYHLFSEALAQAGVSLGLPAPLARSLVADTARGAAALQNQEGAEFAELRRAVTSPHGTTAAAIAIFEENEALRGIVSRATAAACDRAVELSRTD